MLVHVVSVQGWGNEFEAVAAFSSYAKARAYVETMGYSSWAIEELEVDAEDD